MPPKSGRSIEEVVRDEIVGEVGRSVKQAAAEIGPPAGMTKASTAREIALYWLRDNQVDESTFLPQLMSQGIPQQLVQSLQVVQERPELAAAYLQPVQDQETANVLTKVAEYPYRLEILEPIDDPVERAKKAEFLASKGPGAPPPAMQEAEQAPAPAGAPPVEPPAAGAPPVQPQPAMPMSPQQMAGG